MNTDRFCECWNLSCISVCSSLPISAYKWKISTWSEKYMVNNHLKEWTWLRRGQNHAIFCRGPALVITSSIFSCSGRSSSPDEFSLSGLGYSADSLTSIWWNSTHCLLKIGISTAGSSGHASYQLPHTWMWFFRSLNTHYDMLATIYEPSMLQKHSVKCMSLLESIVLLALPQSTRDRRGLHYPSITGSKKLHWLVSIPTTSSSSKAFESVSPGAAHPVELRCLQSR